MNYPLVAIIVLNWRKPAETLACLESLSRITYPNVMHVVVDNGSGDDSVPLIRARYPQAALLETNANLGYAGGNNVGVRWALAHGADFTLILNNDVTVDPGFVESLVEASQQEPGPAVTTPMICEMERPGVIWTLGSDIDWRTGAPVRRHAGDLRTDWQRSRPHRVAITPGTAMLVPRKAWECAGLIDEQYFLYYEEADWCQHALRSGCTMVAVPDSCIWHDTEGAAQRTSPAITYYMTRNALRFLSRNVEQPQRWQGQARVMRMAAWHSLGDLRHGHYARARARWRAIYDYLLGRFGPLPKGAS
ncbi:MAG: glycosyltransferase family 2 protein [Anaerolinea sp.]|nr:glycosyltransferase family 2 protein [Anaerolinea sp.]